MIEGLIFEDQRGVFNDYAPVKIIPDPNKSWIELTHCYFVCCSDTFGEQWFQLNKAEEVKD